MICIRGAVTAEENTRESILENTELLLREIIEKNDIAVEDIVCIDFTATKDLDKAYPAVAARKLGITEAALMCMQEMYVENSLKMCLRVGLFAENGKKQSSAKHIYLKGAQVLRPDIAVIDAVAIDGPAGSGKSTVAKAIAKALGYVYVDTGAMYRTIGLDCSENGIDCRDEKAVSQKAESTDIELKFENGLQKIYLNKKDVTEKIRTQECAENASLVARYPYVREKLASLQRKIAEDTQVVMDGRDIGTNILPGAKTKIYLDASSEVRAKRRVGELKDKGIEADFSQILARVIQRDEQDKNREHNPLTVAKDAHVIDTSNMSVDEVREKILAIVRGE